MSDRKIFYVIKFQAKVYLAYWKGGRVVLLEDQRTPEAIEEAAVEKGHYVTYCGAGIGSKTTSGIVAALQALGASLSDSYDWEPISRIVVRQ